ncbi:MAG TPA: hypothetical protein VGE86_10060, partial [Thermoanaerobaculia bacterium]
MALPVRGGSAHQQEIVVGSRRDHQPWAVRRSQDAIRFDAHGSDGDLDVSRVLQENATQDVSTATS